MAVLMMLLCVTVGVTLVVILSYGVGALSGHLAEKKKTAEVSKRLANKAVEKAKRPEFQITQIGGVWASYNALSEEFKVFPQLEDALRAVEDKIIALGQFHTNSYSTGQERAIRHNYNCVYYQPMYLGAGCTWEPFEYEEDIANKSPNCEACKEYVELSEAVAELYSAQAEREKILLEEKMRVIEQEALARVAVVDGLAASMRNEAKIVRAVTEKVYGTSSE